MQGPYDHHPSNNYGYYEDEGYYQEHRGPPARPLNKERQFGNFPVDYRGYPPLQPPPLPPPLLPPPPQHLLHPILHNGRQQQQEHEFQQTPPSQYYHAHYGNYSQPEEPQRRNNHHPLLNSNFSSSFDPLEPIQYMAPSTVPSYHRHRAHTDDRPTINRDALGFSTQSTDTSRLQRTPEYQHHPRHPSYKDTSSINHWSHSSLNSHHHHHHQQHQQHHHHHHQQQTRPHLPPQQMLPQARHFNPFFKMDSIQMPPPFPFSGQIQGEERHRKSRTNRNIGPTRPKNANFVTASLPCRTLVIKNVGPLIKPKQLTKMIEKLGGEIEEIDYDLQPSKRLVFVSFYDLRDAIKSKDQLSKLQIGGQYMQVHFCLARDTRDLESPCTRERNQGTLIVTINDVKSQAYEKLDIENLFRAHGELRSVRQFDNINYKFFVEFFDHRHCKAADRALNHSPFHGGLITIKLCWDYPPNVRIEKSKTSSRSTIDNNNGLLSSSSSSSSTTINHNVEQQATILSSPKEKETFLPSPSTNQQSSVLNPLSLLNNSTLATNTHPSPKSSILNPKSQTAESLQKNNEATGKSELLARMSNLLAVIQNRTLTKASPTLSLYEDQVKDSETT